MADMTPSVQPHEKRMLLPSQVSRVTPGGQALSSSAHLNLLHALGLMASEHCASPSLTAPGAELAAAGQRTREPLAREASAAAAQSARAAGCFMAAK